MYQFIKDPPPSNLSKSLAILAQPGMKYMKKLSYGPYLSEHRLIQSHPRQYQFIKDHPTSNLSKSLLILAQPGMNHMNMLSYEPYLTEHRLIQSHPHQYLLGWRTHVMPSTGWESILIISTRSASFAHFQTDPTLSNQTPPPFLQKII